MSKKRGIWKFLADSGVLDTGDEVLIKAKKAEWYRLYRNKWQIQKRALNVQVSLYYTKREAAELKKGRGNASLSTIVKLCSLEYVRQRFASPDRAALLAIKEHLSLIYDILSRLYDEGLVNATDCKKVIADMTNLESRYMQTLTAPKRLLDIIGEEIKDTPEFKQAVFTLLNSDSDS